MFTRIIIFSLLTIISGVLFVITLNFGFPPFSYLVFFVLLAGTAGLLYELNYYKTIHLGVKEIIVSYIFKPLKRFNLNEIEEWQEVRYYYRSSLKRTLILFFSGSEKLIIKKDDFHKEFEDILKYLKSNLDHLDGSEARRVKVSKNINLPSVQIYKA